MVLQFLRGNTIDAKTVSASEVDAFIADVDYYSLPVDPVEQWLGRRVRRRPIGEQFSFEAHSEGVLLYGDSVVLQNHDDHYDGWVLGDNSYGGQSSVHVKITLRIDRVKSWIMFGIIGQLPCPIPRQAYWASTCYGLSSTTRRVGYSTVLFNGKRKSPCYDEELFNHALSVSTSSPANMCLHNSHMLA